MDTQTELLPDLLAELKESVNILRVFSERT